MALDLHSGAPMGYLIDATNYYPFPGFDDLEFVSNTDEIVRNAGNGTIENVYASLRAGWEGTVSWNFQEAGQIATLTGGTVTATSGITLVEEESGTIPANPGPYTVTLTGAATCVDTSVGHGSVYTGTGTSKAFFKRVTGAPATGEFSIASGVLTFAAADQGKSIRTTYLKTNTTGNKVIVDPTDNPTAFEGYLVLKTLKQTGTTLGTVTVHCKSLIWTGPFNILAKDGVVSRTFRANNYASGDIELIYG